MLVLCSLIVPQLCNTYGLPRDTSAPRLPRPIIGKWTRIALVGTPCTAYSRTVSESEKRPGVWVSPPFGKNLHPGVASGNPLAPADQRSYLAFGDGSRTWGLSRDFIEVTWARNLWHDVNRFFGMEVLIDEFEEEEVPAHKLPEIARRLRALANSAGNAPLRQETESVAAFLDSAVAAGASVWFIF